MIDAGERGRLDIHPGVLRKIVEHAADQVPGTLRHGRRVAGIDVGEAGASARIVVGAGDPSAVDVALELTVQYPAVVRSVVDAVRSRIGEDLGFLAGCRLRVCTVTVSGLRAAAAPPPARLR